MCSGFTWVDRPSIRLLDNDPYPLSLPPSSMQWRGYHLVEVKSELIRPEAHACTFPSYKQHSKSICHQTCGVSGWFSRACPAERWCGTSKRTDLHLPLSPCSGPPGGHRPRHSKDSSVQKPQDSRQQRRSCSLKLWFWEPIG